MPAKILVVEDHADSREMLTTFLGGEGFTIICADDGQAGYELALAEKPDFILTDINMPILNGIEMIKRLRRHPDTASIPVVVLSAYQSGVMAEAMKAGANEAMGKPAQLIELIKLIKSLSSAASSMCLLACAPFTTYMA
jgi:two-component system phosphate regulon response regulator PhoB